MKQGKKLKQVQPVNESLSYTVEVRDKEGRVLQRISAPSHCYVAQWNQLIRCQAAHATTSIVITDGFPNSNQEDIITLRCNAGAGVTLYGLLVGKGFTPVAIDDFALEIPLEEGVGVDEFNHQAVTFTAPAVVGPTCSFTIKRIFVNNSGATISDIREIGAYVSGDSPPRSYCGFRDVLPGGVTVPDGGTITVTYTIPVTV